MVRFLGAWPLSFWEEPICSVLREGLELVADVVGGRRAWDEIKRVSQRGQQINNELTCERSCAENGIIFRLVDLR